MVITGLEIGGIVVGCVNAGLSAAKLIHDWYNKRKERKLEPRNRKLEDSLRSDARSLDSAYRHHLQQIQKHDQRRFEIGDDQSRTEIGSSSRKLQEAMRDLRTKIKKSKGKVVPDLARIMATSNGMQAAIVEALARLHRRIVLETRVPRSLNPLRLFGLGSDKTRLQKEKKRSAAVALARGALGSSSRPTLLPASSSSPPPSPQAGNITSSASSPDLALLPQSPPSCPTQPVSGLAFPRLPWEIEVPHSHAADCLWAGQTPHCACGRQQVVIVDKVYVNSQNTTNNSSNSNNNSNNNNKGTGRSKTKKPKKSSPKQVATEIVLVRRPVRS